MTGTIFDIKEMAVHDGPGIRTTVFFKGCPLRCCWCHNPEGLSFMPQLMYKKARCKGCKSCTIPCDHKICKPFKRCILACPEGCLEISGKTVSADELAIELIKTAEVLNDSFGGFTFSGGEPLAQPEFLSELCDKLQNFHLCIETSGYASEDVFKSIIEKMNFVIMDIKLFDSELHKKYTGVGNSLILRNFEYLQKSGKPHIIRTPLIPEITDTKENLLAIEKLIGNSDWEKLPYNGAAGAKYQFLGMDFPMDK